MKTTKVRKNTNSESACSWFDSQNARLIILCATLGVFGAHKFAQRKYFQGFIYILLDLTVVGIILTLILSWIDLIFLTAKPDNCPGNMMLGAAFILLASVVLIPGSSRVVIKNINPLFVSARDSLVAVEATTKDGEIDESESLAPETVETESVESEPLAPETAEKDIENPITVSIDGMENVAVFTTETGEIPSDVTIDDGAAAAIVVVDAVAESPENTVAVVPETQNAQKIESVVTAEMAPALVNESEKTTVTTKKAAVKPKPVAKKSDKNVAAPSADNNKKSEYDDFGSFSLYNMITGA